MCSFCLWFQVNFTSENLVICFKGFFSPGITNDCVFGPPSDSPGADFVIYPRIPVLETIMSSNVRTIKAKMDCLFSVSFQHNGAYVSSFDLKFLKKTFKNRNPWCFNRNKFLFLFSLQSTLAPIKFGSQSVLYVYVPAMGSVVSSDLCQVWCVEEQKLNSRRSNLICIDIENTLHF